MRYVVIFFVISLLSSCQAIQDYARQESSLTRKERLEKEAEKVRIEAEVWKKAQEEAQRKAQEEAQRKADEEQRIIEEHNRAVKILKTQTKQVEDIRFAKIVETIKENSYKVVPFQRYKLYTTANIYNSLLLDTQTGIIKQVQWSFELEKEYSIYVNSEDLTYKTGYGSFELYPTQNQFTYILLDKMSGRKWHVQWGFEDGERWIRRIY